MKEDGARGKHFWAEKNASSSNFRFVMSDSSENIFTLEPDGDAHQRGDKGCPACWSGHPAFCDCGGLIHADFIEKDDVYSMTTLCDKCGAKD